jgi:hypothetical protein
MSHSFNEFQNEPEPRTGGSLSGGPPRKHTAAGVLDPPSPPKKPLNGMLVALVLAALGLIALVIWFKVL